MLWRQRLETVCVEREEYVGGRGRVILDIGGRRRVSAPTHPPDRRSGPTIGRSEAES